MMLFASRFHLVCALALSALVGNAAPLGTAFTYQGRLDSDGAAAEGSYDLRFTLYDAGTGGASVGSAVTTNGVTVSNGLFIASLDFGASPFAVGQARWLQIEVRTNGTGTFTELAPRQSLSAIPYSLYAPSSGTAGLADRVRAGSITSSSLANGSVSGAKLAAGAAAANLAASGLAGVPSGGVILSSRPADTNLLSAGYSRLSAMQVGDVWKGLATPGDLYPGIPGLPGRQNHTAIWTGSEMIVWGGAHEKGYWTTPYDDCLNDGGRFNLAANSWSPVNLTGAPSPRWHHTAIWTGTEMIIWGGTYYFGPPTGQRQLVACLEGGRYNPVTDSWSPINTNGAPAPREFHTAIWTGTEMIVWGGLYRDESNNSLTNRNDGARYNPATDTWSPISSDGALSVRGEHTAVWTGTEMIVWGGNYYVALPSIHYVYLGDGARYNPASDSWSPLTANPALSARSGHTAAWTGSNMIVWGGGNWQGTNTPYTDGARYNPVSGNWTLMNPNNAPSPRQDFAAVWTGSDLLVWGGFVDSTAPRQAVKTGGRYDPVADRWITISANVGPSGRWRHSAAWTGSEMIIWGGLGGDGTWPADTSSYAPGRDLYYYQRP